MPQKALAVVADMLVNYKAYVGRYQVSPDFVLNITCQAKKLYCRANDQQKLQLYTKSETEFFIRELDAAMTFIKDSNGNVHSLILHQNGKDVTAKK